MPAKGDHQEKQTEELEAARGANNNKKKARFLVPISVVCRQERAEDGTCSQSHIDCISWCLVPTDCNQKEASEQPKTLLVGPERLSLAEALKQVS